MGMQPSIWLFLEQFMPKTLLLLNNPGLIDLFIGASLCRDGFGNGQNQRLLKKGNTILVSKKVGRKLDGFVLPSISVPSEGRIV